MERRSARLKDTPARALQEDPDFEDDGAANMDVDDQPVRKSTKSKGKKRKNSEEPTQPIKRLRGKRGILKNMVDMPMDVLFEIFGQLEPLDLLHLARTTKAIRNILMSKSSLSVWKSAFENVDTPLPECPPDLCEPAFADLALGKGCHFCGRNLSFMNIAWQCRFRSCTKCIDDHFTDNRRAVGDGYPSKVSDLLPSVSLMRSTGRYSRWRTYYWKGKDREWKAEYDDLMTKEEREAWCDQKIAEAQALREHSNLCATWAKDRIAARERDKENAIDDRRAIVIEHLREMGWGEEYDRIPEGDSKPEYTAEVNRACAKTITERVLTNLEPHLEQFMEAVQKKRIDGERQEFLKTRIMKLKEVYENYIATLPNIFGHPNTADIFQLPAVRDIVNNCDAPELCDMHIDRLVKVFPEAIQAWQTLVKEQLVEIIVDTVAKDNDDAAAAATTTTTTTTAFTFDRSTILDEASTFFFCRECGTQLHARDMPMHHCARVYRHWEWYGTESSAEDIVFRTSLREIRFNAAKTIHFHPKTVTKVASVLNNLKYDPKIITADGLDNEDPIIECLKCHSEREGRSTMRWTQLPIHLQHSDTHDMLKHFRVIDEPEAGIVRRRIKEKHEMAFADNGSPDRAVCAHCREKGGYITLLNHTRTEHNTNRPKIGVDIIPNPFVGVSRDLREPYRLWPPLAQEDVDALTA